MAVLHRFYCNCFESGSIGSGVVKRVSILTLVAILFTRAELLEQFRYRVFMRNRNYFEFGSKFRKGISLEYFLFFCEEFQ